MKSKYHIRNWGQYNKSLIQRGSITVWFSGETVDQWQAIRIAKRGRPFRYSDTAIMTALIIRSVFHLPLRALEGFLFSLTLIMKLDLSIPSYSQISRRASLLGQDLQKLSKRKITDLVVDSTGLKVYGEGEWKVRKHGVGKRRTWRKLHLAVCPDTHEILFDVLTENNVGDCEVYPDFVKKAPKGVKRFYGDGAYDTQECYKSHQKHGSEPIIPPQRNAVFHEDAPSYMDFRNKSILQIIGLGGDESARRLWKKLKNYHRRSLGETVMFRLKQLFGGNLRSREFSRQKAEVRAKCMALNIMTRLGVPQGEWLEV